MLAQGLSAEMALSRSACICGRAGRRNLFAKEQGTERSAIASEIADHIAFCFRGSLAA